MRIPFDLLDAIRAHGRDTYPEECCGFLLGTFATEGNHVRATRRVANRQDANRERRYTITPRDFLAAEREARERGMDIVGIYHSHPDHPARPSPTDLAEATFPGYTYVIVSVRAGEDTELTAWSLAPDRSRFDPEDITIKMASEVLP